ncbi:MAG: LysR substrate-binding domain-containing protein [Propionibacteriaceae bacterium]|nr:LysR substrate-binding domain-containing protein [Propionibacteriaceae bacterium]
MELNPRWIMVFRAIAQTGSISAGARTLGLTQPTAAAHLTALERSVGVPLILRHHYGITLTETGVAVLSHANAIAEHMDAIASETANARCATPGPVRMVAFAAALGTFIPQAWGRLRDTVGAQIKLSLTSASPADALALLNAGKADIAVVYQHSGDPQAVDLARYKKVSVAEYEVRLAMPAKHELASAINIGLADFADDDWAFGFSSCHDHLIDLCHAAGFDPHVRYVSDDYAITQELVADAHLVAPLTESCLALRANPLVVSRTIPALGTHVVSAVCHPGAERIPTTRAVLKALRMPVRQVTDTAASNATSTTTRLPASWTV